VSKILGGSAERLNAGSTSPAVRETASSVYHVVQGSGYSEINGQRFDWKQGDTFCVPAWNKYQHTAAAGSEDVYLYRFHDKPMLTSLGFYRVDGVDSETLVSD
jgi:gentisate 1,2-dioxygenase